MTSPESALHVEMVGDEIVVSLPESQYSVTYYKAETSSQLRAKHITEKYHHQDDRVRVPRTGPEARQRHGLRAGVDKCSLQTARGVPLMRGGPLGRAPRK
jgi:hypothetical protein